MKRRIASTSLPLSSLNPCSHPRPVSKHNKDSTETATEISPSLKRLLPLRRPPPPVVPPSRNRYLPSSASRQLRLIQCFSVDAVDAKLLLQLGEVEEEAVGGGGLEGSGNGGAVDLVGEPVGRGRG